MTIRLLPVIAVVVAACSASDGLNTTSTSLSMTTTSTRSTTTSVPLIFDGGLVPTDPGTLVPRPGMDPLLVGDSHSGLVSPNRRWAAIQSWNGDDETESISVIDLRTNEVVATADVGADDMVITDNGDVYYFDSSSPTEIHLLEENGVSLFSADLPSDMFHMWDTLTHLGEGRLAYLGHPLEGSGPVSVVVAADDELSRFEVDRIVSGNRVSSPSSRFPFSGSPTRQWCGITTTTEPFS